MKQEYIHKVYSLSNEYVESLQTALEQYKTKSDSAMVLIVMEALARARDSRSVLYPTIEAKAKEELKRNMEMLSK